MEEEKFDDILKKMQSECNKANAETKGKKPRIIYEVLQHSDIGKEENIIEKIADFYDKNWVGNKDFMHIPDAEQVQKNYENYPIIIAREEDKDEILGISTIKYDENTEQSIDPYFPVEDAKYFSITGILVKNGTSHRGIGKKIYELAVSSVYEYNKDHPETKLMCVVDCRNKHSLKALATAVDNINNSGRIGEDKELPANIIGYYEVRDLATKEKLQEGPTLVLEVDLNGRPISNKEEVKLEYKNVIPLLSKSLKDKSRIGESRIGKLKSYIFNPFGIMGKLYNSLSADLETKLAPYGFAQRITNEDPECGMVYYYPLKNRLPITHVEIEPNGTEKGNNRKPNNIGTKNENDEKNCNWRRKDFAKTFNYTPERNPKNNEKKPESTVTNSKKVVEDNVK